MEADILFMPYNYLFLLDARSTDDQPIIDIENSIIIVDEAHNIRAFAEDQGSFEISN
jgi:regulator of telomere elongation helicase 1